MSTAVKKFNTLVGNSTDYQSLQKIKELAKNENQTILSSRIDNALNGLTDPSIVDFIIDAPAIEQTPEAVLHGLDPTPDYFENEDTEGLNKAVSPDEIYQYITDLIIETINQGDDLPWQKEWSSTGLASGEIAYNYISKKDYRGINFWLLNFKAVLKEGKMILESVNYENPAFLTFKQIDKLGGKIIKGSTGNRVVYFTTLWRYQQAEPALDLASYDVKKFKSLLLKNKSKINVLKGSFTIDNLIAQSRIPILKYYNIYNAGDVEGIDFEKLAANPNATADEATKIQVAESIVKNYPNPPKIKYQGNQPSYVPGIDTVMQTPLSDWKNPQAFYCTLYHELIHSTGAKKRLNRTFGKNMKDPNYAKEELVAEMGAVYLCAESGILFQTLNNSAAYLKGWNRNLVKAMKVDNRLFFRAASAAQAATDHILDKNEKGVPAYLLNIAPKVQEKKSIKTKSLKNSTQIEKAIDTVKKLAISDLNEYDFDATKRKYKVGDKYSSNFDYKGMLLKVSKITTTTPINTLVKLYDSLTDVNYHNIAKNLLELIDLRVEKAQKKQINNFIKEVEASPAKKIPAKKSNAGKQLALLGAKGKGLKCPQTKPIPKQAQTTHAGASSVPAVSVSSSSSRLKRAEDIKNMHFDTLKFDEGWEQFLQSPAKNMKIAIWALPKEGKSSGACTFATYLTKFGNVLYNFVDQGINSSTQKILNYTSLDSKNNAFVTDAMSLEHLHQDIKDSKADFVFIDMINQYIDEVGLTAAQFKRDFIKRYPKISFILVFEVTKGGNFKGDQSWTHLVDQLVTVKDYIMSTKGRYGTGEKIVWLEEAKKLAPERVTEILNFSESTETVENKANNNQNLEHNFEIQ